MYYDEWLVCRVMTVSNAAHIHAVTQNLTAYVSAARLLDKPGRLAPNVRDRVDAIRAHHERVLRSYLVTHDIAESRDLVEQFEANPC